MQNKEPQIAEEAQPRQAPMDIPGITPGKEVILGEIVRLTLPTLELFELRVKDGKRGLVRTPRIIYGFTYFEMP